MEILSAAGDLRTLPTAYSWWVSCYCLRLPFYSRWT